MIEGVGGATAVVRNGLAKHLILLWILLTINTTRVITKADENYENQMCSPEPAFMFYFIILKSQLLFGAFGCCLPVDIINFSWFCRITDFRKDLCQAIAT